MHKAQEGPKTLLYLVEDVKMAMALYQFGITTTSFLANIIDN
jgi:hypothetical protein